MRHVSESAEFPRWQTPPSYATGAAVHHQRQAFNRPRTSLGVAGHWIHLVGVAAPLIIGELVKDFGARQKCPIIACLK